MIAYANWLIRYSGELAVLTWLWPIIKLDCDDVSIFWNLTTCGVLHVEYFQLLTVNASDLIFGKKFLAPPSLRVPCSIEHYVNATVSQRYWA